MNKILSLSENSQCKLMLRANSRRSKEETITTFISENPNFEGSVVIATNTAIHNETGHSLYAHYEYFVKNGEYIENTEDVDNWNKYISNIKKKEV